MKLNPDCIRDILSSIESMEYNSVMTISKLHLELPNYSEEELNYHCLQMIDADLIKAKAINSIGSVLPEVWRVFDLTYYGHEFLADIRSENIWNKTKSVAHVIGAESIAALKNIAAEVVTSLIKSHFGL